MSDKVLIAPEYLSPSSVSTFNQCPLKFKYSKIDGLQDSGTEATMLGNFVHEVLEAMYGLAPDLRTQETAKVLARELWASKWSDEISTLIHDEKNLNRFRWTAWWCIENLWRLEDPALVIPHSVESHVRGEIGGVKIHGFIDRLAFENDTATVTDYKTGKTPRKGDLNDRFFQLIIYTQLLESVDIFAANNLVELLYLKDGIRFQKEINKEDINQITEKLQSTRVGIEERCKAGYFEPSTSFLCNWCGFKPICPAWKR
jgi:putative RecB family exonuclease